MSRKAVPQRRWSVRYCWTLERRAVLERVDALVLGAVVGEDAGDVGHEAHARDVTEEDEEPQGAVDHVPHDRPGERGAHDPVRQVRRQDDEETDRERHA
jgi:hypothetical protein